MAEKIKMSRQKIPYLDRFIVTGDELRRDDEKFQALAAKFEILERKFQSQLKRIKIESKMYEKLLYQISVLSGRIKAPECPKCGKPKKAGGIQWLDHAICKRKKPEAPADSGNNK